MKRESPLLRERSVNVLNPKECIGVVPAAGQAVRLSPVPCSKEIYPIGVSETMADGSALPKVAGQYLLEKFSHAHVTRAFIILRKGKWDIPQYFGDGSSMGMDLGYLIMGNPNGVPFTVDQAFSFVENKMVAFGFPDILFPEQHAFTSLIQAQAKSDADLVLGLFPCGAMPQADRVDVHENGWVRQVLPRSTSTHLLSTWGIAVWTSVFTNFLHDFLAPLKRSAHLDTELSLSEVIQAALEHGLKIHSITVSQKPFVDIGTPEGLAQARMYE